MEAKSKLMISNWQYEQMRPDVSPPTILEYFYKDENNKKVQNHFEYLTYLHDTFGLDHAWTQRSQVNQKTSITMPRITKERDEIENYRILGKLAFLTTTDMISKIMNTRFSIVDYSKRKWTIYAVQKGNAFHLFSDDDETPQKPFELLKQYELLKRYLFVKKPSEIYCNIFSIYNPIQKALYELRIGNNIVYYVSEFPGIDSDKPVQDLKSLNAAEHVYCDVTENIWFDETDLIYDPQIWAKAKLIKAKKIIYGIYQRKIKDYKCDYALKDILWYDIEIFDSKCKLKNMWSPDAAWNFLNSFLTFAKNEIERVEIDSRHKYIWKFTSFENHMPCISCEVNSLEVFEKRKRREALFRKWVKRTVIFMLLIVLLYIFYPILSIFGFFTLLNKIGEITVGIILLLVFLVCFTALIADRLNQGAHTN